MLAYTPKPSLPTVISELFCIVILCPEIPYEKSPLERVLSPAIIPLLIILTEFTSENIPILLLDWVEVPV